MSVDRVRAVNASIGEYAPGRHGVRLVSIEAETVVGQIDVEPGLVAGNGFLFAPVVVSLADFLCASGVSEHLPDGAIGFTTVELKANFIGTARAGETVEGRATISHTGRTTQVWDCEVKNLATDKVIALFRCTQLVMYPR